MQQLSNRFIIIIPVFNAATLIGAAIESVMSQEFDNLGIIIRDDISTDGTPAVLHQLLGIDGVNTTYKRVGKKDICYVRNNEKLYGGGNTYHSVLHYVKNKDAVIGVVDGDDQLIDNKAAKKIYRLYEKHNMWMVWSQHQSRQLQQQGLTGYSSRLPPDEIIYSSRNYWAVSHFRTCKAWLFNKINRKDLKDPFCEAPFFRVAGDAALLYPLIELCGNQKSFFLDEVLYLYNDGLCTNEAALYPSDVSKYTQYIREVQHRYKQQSALQSKAATNMLIP
ncbi:glycosyltransferase [uncultured Chitinophaga sp.]|jgi:Glycosyltransferases involved in cell wall biogenesis|uniref:glycosyltransferase family 2 protein n=1 Tax=uncultured Chitinophaga sp. TaxID=339340 RepID=UPI00262FE2B9|nr:glycosyltransferase [uncultured Chitinophaga sp.]